jgi:hypothetical protein
MRFFWALGIPMGLINASAVWWRARLVIAQSPSLRRDVDRIFRVVLLANVVPFSLLGFRSRGR